MAQKNRANMLTDIVSNIYNNLINFITGQNAQDRFVNLLDSSPNILSDASQANGYVSTDANNEMFSSYYDEEISRADLISDLTANLAVGGKFYRINDAVGSTITLLVIAESNINLYSIGTDITTGEQGTYDITTDVFTPIVVSGTPDLQQVTDVGFTTTNKIASSNGAGSATVLNNGNIDIATGDETVTIEASLVTTAYNAQLPNKLSSPQTFAMLSDVTGGGDVFLANDQTFTGENTFDIPSGNDTPVTITKGGNNAGLKVTKSSGSGDAIEVAEGSVSIADETASTIAHFDGSKRIKSLATSTYPSLTELSYVKGVTSDIQTQFNSKQAKTLANCANGTPITGVTTIQYSKGLLIPANSRGANDAPQIEATVLKTGGAGNLTIRMYWNTTNDITTGSPILLGTFGPSAANFSSMVRVLMIQVANGSLNATRTTNATGSTAVGWVAGGSAASTLAIDWTIDGYLICAVQNTSASDSSVGVMVKLN
jgi:hypothetical protein